MLLSLREGLISLLDASHKVFTDLPGLRASEVPLEVMVSSSRPDIEVIQGKELHLLELTVCGNTMEPLALAQTRKAGKLEYLQVLSDADRNGWKAKYTTIDIGALGHHHLSSLTQLPRNFSQIPSSKWREVLSRAAIIAVNCSRARFLWPLNKPPLTT